MAARVDMTYPERKENASNLASVDESLPIIILMEGERRAAGLVLVSLFSLAIFFTYIHADTLAHFGGNNAANRRGVANTPTSHSPLAAMMMAGAWLHYAFLSMMISSSIGLVDHRISVVNILTENRYIAFQSSASKLQVALSGDGQKWSQWQVTIL